MSDFIPSKYYLNYCKENGIEFTDRERVTMLLQDYRLTLEEKLAELEKIAAGSSDSELKNAIEVRVKTIREGLEAICSSEKCCVFLVEERCIAFDNFEAAREYCKTLFKKQNYRIKKHRILSSCDEASDFRSSYCGGITLNADYEIVNVSYKNISLDAFSDKLTYCFIPFRHPFERGDIVSDCRTGEVGIIETSQEEWQDYLKKSENNRAYDFSDAGLIVQFLQNDGFMHFHIQPIYLEKLPLNQNGVPMCFDTKNNFKEYLICCASKLMRRELALSDFMSIFLEWHEERIYKEIKSNSWRDNIDTKNKFEEYLISCALEFMCGELALDAFLSIFLEWHEEHIYKEIKSSSRRGNINFPQ